MNRIDEDNWAPMTALPVQLQGLTGVTINNRVFMAGYIGISLYLIDALTFILKEATQDQNTVTRFMN